MRQNVTKYNMVTFIKNYWLSLIVIAIIVYLSFFTPPQTAMPTIPYMDKIVHFCMYGGLTGVLWTQYFWCHKNIQKSHLSIGGILCPIAMSGLIEIGQSTLTVNRTGDWMDFIANTLGVFVATLVGYYIVRPLVYQYKQQHSY